MNRSFTQVPIFTLILLLQSLAAVAQQAAGGGPRPEVRAHIDAFVQALNSGSADKWEEMVQKHFSETALKRRTPEERKELFERLRGDFGTVKVDRVERHSTEAPLELYLEGSTGTSGVVELTLQPDTPFLIEGLRVRIGGGASGGMAANLSLPLLTGNMREAELARTLDAYFIKLTSEDRFSGNVLIAQSGKPVYEKSFGLADRANNVANTRATRFNVGSINKTFTQAAVQQLVARRKLAMTDTVSKWLPDYSQELTRGATIAQLLNHRGGVADFFGEEFSKTSKSRFRSNADYYKFVSEMKPVFAPGAREQYCNGCYIVLGQIIERASGVRYEEYVRENIFKPAGMNSTGPLQADGIDENVAMGYTASGGMGLRSNIYSRGAAGSAAGGGYSTTADLLAYVQARNQKRIPDVGPFGDGVGIAGGAPGINAVVEQEGDWTVVVMTNMDPPTAQEIGSSLAQSLSRQKR
jgi:CubicO group peptidase (beta-lactamase class C family)